MPPCLEDGEIRLRLRHPRQLPLCGSHERSGDKLRRSDDEWSERSCAMLRRCPRFAVTGQRSGTQPQLTPAATLLKTQSIGQLRPSSHARVRLNATLPSGQTAAGCYVIAVLDSGGVLPEMLEGNNTVVSGPIP